MIDLETSFTVTTNLEHATTKIKGHKNKPGLSGSRQPTYSLNITIHDMDDVSEIEKRLIYISNLETYRGIDGQPYRLSLEFKPKSDTGSLYSPDLEIIVTSENQAWSKSQKNLAHFLQTHLTYALQGSITGNLIQDTTDKISTIVPETLWKPNYFYNNADHPKKRSDSRRIIKCNHNGKMKDIFLFGPVLDEDSAFSATIREINGLFAYHKNQIFYSPIIEECELYSLRADTLIFNSEFSRGLNDFNRAILINDFLVDSLPEKDLTKWTSNRISLELSRLGARITTCIQQGNYSQASQYLSLSTLFLDHYVAKHFKPKEIEPPNAIKTFFFEDMMTVEFPTDIADLMNDYQTMCQETINYNVIRTAIENKIATYSETLDTGSIILIPETVLALRYLTLEEKKFYLEHCITNIESKYKERPTTTPGTLYGSLKTKQSDIDDQIFNRNKIDILRFRV